MAEPSPNGPNPGLPPAPWDPERWFTRAGRLRIMVFALVFAGVLILGAAVVGYLADWHFSQSIEVATDRRLEGHAVIAARRLDRVVVRALLDRNKGPDDTLVRYAHDLVRGDAEAAGLRRIVIFERSGRVAIDSLDIKNRGHVDYRLRVNQKEIDRAVEQDEPVTSVLYEIEELDGTRRLAKTSYAPVPADAGVTPVSNLIAAVELPADYEGQVNALRTVIWTTWAAFSALIAVATVLALELFHRLNLQYEEHRRRAELSDLSAAVAHEIKNPLAAMRMSLDLHKRAKSEAVKQDLVARLERQVLVLDRMVKDFLAYARGTRGTQTTREPATLGQIVADIRRQLTDAQDGCLSVECDPMFGFVTDGVALAQCLANLVKNACDAALASAAQSPAGPPSVKLSAVVRGGTLTFEVSDNGPGIPEDVRERLFEPFNTSATGGSGLGLAIVRRLVSDLGGTITCESAPGSGTKFTVVFPLPDAKRTHRREQSA